CGQCASTGPRRTKTRAERVGIEWLGCCRTRRGHRAVGHESTPLVPASAVDDVLQRAAGSSTTEWTSIGTSHQPPTRASNKLFIGGSASAPLDRQRALAQNCNGVEM